MKIRKVPWLTLLVVAVLLIVALLRVIRIAPENRTYIIGWDVDPPDQVATKSAEPTGFAVELVREAAKRRGIRLKWVLHPESSEAALLTKSVDLWPMMVITEDRKKIFHITDPYQDDKVGLLVDANSAFRTAADLRHQTISYVDMPINERLLRQHFPGSVHLRKSSLADAIRSVCSGEAQAVFANQIAVFALLLGNRPCPNASLRLLPIPTINTLLGIGATQEARAAADAIRDEISVMAGDGSLGEIISAWSYDAGRELNSLVILQQARSRLQWYRIGFGLVGVLFLFASWSAAGYRWQRIKAQKYGQALNVAERKVRAEQALRESEERFRNMADTAPVMIWVSGPDKRFTFFNKTWLDFTGLTMEQELGSGWATGVHPDDLEGCFATYSSSFDARLSFRMEYRLRRAGGEYRWVLDNGIPLYTGGEFTGYIGSCIDVTDQKLAQDRLRTSERRLIEAQRLAQIGSWERHFEGEAIYWSDEMFRIFGLPVGPPLHFLKFLSFVHPDDQEKIRESNREAVSSRAPVIVEFRITRPDGEMRFVRSVVEVIGNDPSAYPRIAGATQDITDRKRAEEERARLATLVEKEHERLNAIISSIPGAVWETSGSPDNPAKQVEFMSNQVEEMLGYHVEEWMTAPGLWPLIVHPDDRSRFVREAIEILTSDKGSGSHQYRCLTKDGRTVWLESHASAIREKTGTPVGLRGVTIDISERKEAQAALQRAQEELARVTRAISMGEVAASIAHEINQPLAAVVTNGEACLRFLAATAPNIQKAKAILTSIISDGNRASEVIRRIRALFAKASGQKEICDLNQLIRETTLLLQEYAHSHNVLVRTDLEASLPPVVGDRTQLRQLLLNLATNGIEAAGKGLHEARLVVIMTRNDAPPGVRLEVSDSGIGIQPGDRERIFHPFFTTKEAGLGMGLAISRTIVESHGGRILVEPNQPHGTRLLVFLPNERMGATRSCSA